MDALFGLPRKKSAGKSVRPPLTSNLFFEDQTAIDEYVSMHSKEKAATTKSNMVCLAMICIGIVHNLLTIVVGLQ